MLSVLLLTGILGIRLLTLILDHPDVALGALSFAAFASAALIVVYRLARRPKATSDR